VQQPSKNPTVAVTIGGKVLQIEYLWVGAHSGPIMVFLHEGLGSASMWSPFAQQLCTRLNLRGLVYSRPGYGQSTPRPETEQWPVSFLQDHAQLVLPKLLNALDLTEPVFFLGHSDGASIALLYCALAQSRLNVRGCVAIAPHVFVEPISLFNIEQTRQAYLNTDLKQKLGRHHLDPDSAFWGWNNAWLAPAFAQWRIDQLLSSVACPVLLIQGQQDEYGTLKQLTAIEAVIPNTQRMVIENCGHWPHKNHAQTVTDRIARWLDQ
jgi:pimeloyl-ACP methyl ester carboxylesterase